METQERVIRLHETDIITFRKNGGIVLSADGKTQAMVRHYVRNQLELERGQDGNTRKYGK